MNARVIGGISRPAIATPTFPGIHCLPGMPGGEWRVGTEVGNAAGRRRRFFVPTPVPKGRLARSAVSVSFIPRQLRFDLCLHSARRPRRREEFSPAAKADTRRLNPVNAARPAARKYEAPPLRRTWAVDSAEAGAVTPGEDIVKSCA